MTDKEFQEAMDAWYKGEREWDLETARHNEGVRKEIGRIPGARPWKEIAEYLKGVDGAGKLDIIDHPIGI